MMLPTLDLSASTRHYRPQVYHREHDPRLLSQSFNGPEENDETLGEDPPPSANSDSCSEWRSVGPAPDSLSRVAAQHYLPYQPPIGLPAAFTALTPYPSHAHRSQSSLESHMDGWHPSSIASSFLQGGCSSSLPSSPPSVGSCSDCVLGPGERSQSLPSHSIPGVDSLEQPGSLRSIPPGASRHNYCLPLYPCGPRAPVCCGQSPAEPHRMGPMSHHKPWLDCRGLYGPMGPHPCRCHDGGFSQSRHQPPQPRQKLVPPSAPLSLEQRRLFVTYEADSEMHEKEVIRFAALLRHNGFDVHIDVFEQQFRSISKIDFMEKFISEKDYLIIIAISPKYYETVTYSHMNMENDERTLITVYIHKQLQNEFIQNGSRNFRFIPILFPGAKKCHVPTWLQNTHVYSWPLDRDDILRRLMRVEKYNPPPIGELPTIVSIPL